MPNPTLKSVIFWQWANQSLNGALMWCLMRREAGANSC